MNINQRSTFYVTTPIYYVTAKPHLGSLYSTVLADIFARWYTERNAEVFFLTGTDEHGQKIAQAAAQAHKDPKSFVDGFIPAYQEAWKRYHIDYTYFMRTTDEYHVRAVQEWIEQLKAQGDIYLSHYVGWYCTHCEMFVAEKEGEYAQQAPPCSSCGRPTHEVSEPTYFFRLSAYQDRLLQFYQEHPDFIVPHARGQEVITFVTSGLKDLSISRTTVKWGIPFPQDAAHVVYVWADALNNYITALGYGQAHKKENFKQWWPANMHIIGKDILRFHAVYWPAFLMAAKLPLPQQLLVHGWINVNNEKMSKSRGNVVDPLLLADIYGADPIRYYLARQMAITHDGNFDEQDIKQRIASDLADDLGNLLNRVVLLALKYQSTVIQSPHLWSEPSLELRSACWDAIEDIEQHMNERMVHMAIARLWRFINQVNAYVHRQEPWKLAKTNPALYQEIMAGACNALYAIAHLLWPVMPQKMEQLLKSIGKQRMVGHDMITVLQDDVWNHSFVIADFGPLFEKPEVEKQEPVMQQPNNQPEINYCTIDDVTKVELRVGTITQAVAVEKSDKLIVMQIDFGPLGMRQILAGVRKSMSPESLVGQQSVFVYNLKPRMMMGYESQGMLLTAAREDGKVVRIMPPESVPNGTLLR